MGRWSREELERAFEHYQREVEEAAATGEWGRFADLFAEEATYTEHAYGNFAGRDEIRAWVVKTMTTFPGSEMTSFPIAWQVIDEDKGWIVCEIRNLMRDPGDGSAHEATNLTILRYAGDGLWANEEDVYNPTHFLTMVTAYLQRCAELDTLSEDGRNWAAAMRIPLLA